MYLIAGLGNPEKKYDNTRHNIGFRAARLLSDKCGVNLNKSKFKSVYGDGSICGEKVIIALPQTYMNLSGESVYEIAAFYKIQAENIIIINDDISLPEGKIRIRSKGSAGGHNGLKSIISCLGTDNFTRIKIGVGAPPNPDYDLADYVLGKFSKEDEKILSDVLENVAGAIKCIIESGTERAMNKYN